MSDILILGYYGFKNSGDDALLLSIIEQLRKQKNDIKINVLRTTRLDIDINLKNEGKIELIMEKNIYHGLISQMNRDLKNKSIRNGSLNVHVLKDNPDIYLLICDGSMNLGLFKNDGSYDQNRILNSNDSESLKWANALFENIKSRVI